MTVGTAHRAGATAPPSVLAFPGRLPLATGLLILYAGLVMWGAAHHALWRDEIQAWLIARDSPDLPALLHNLRYEGHPALWHLAIWPFARLGRDPALMQIPNLVFSIAAVALVLWRAPLTRWELALFPFGYFILFDYAVKSRSYALGTLLTVAACALWPRRRSHPVLLAGVLALLANVHLLFAILSGALAAAVAIDRLRTTGWQPPRRREVLALVLLAAGWGLAVATAWPAPDALAGRTLHTFDAGRMAPELVAFAGLVGPYTSAAATALGLAALGAAFVVVRRDPAAVVMLALATGLMLALFMLAYGSNIWHRGPILLAVLAALWIARLSPDAARDAAGVAGRALLVSLLALQAIAGVMALWRDARHPLSAGAAVARHIVAQGWRNDPLLGTPDYAVSTIVGYLGIAGAHYGNVGRFGSFALWDRARTAPRDAARMLADAAHLPRPTTLVTTEPLAPALATRHGYREVARFDDATEPSERFVLYRRD